ncbi:ATP-grasp domain-containing protein [Streptomyces sp. NPDC051907]|uniref:carboxylate--amine ligase n=1 Tax=Streptomyces sp. NPDC051907 TaxID=3155284 RepID=UPI00341F9DEB
MTRTAAFDAGVPALVLRLDRNPFHHGTLGAVRSLGRAGVEVHAVVESRRSPVGRSRYLHRAHVRPRGPMTWTRFVETLLQVSDRIGRPAVLIAMDDLSAIGVAAHATRLASRYLFPAQPADLPALLADKAELAALCERAGIEHPRTVLPASAAEAADAVRGLGLPLVAKWSRPWLLAPHAADLRSTTLVRSPADARRLFERTEQAGSRLLLQRYLPDGPDRDWFFHGYFAGGPADQPSCPLGGSGRKELSWPPRTGLTAVGRWQPNPAVEEAALRLVAEVGYRGILDLDFRRDEAAGTYQLLDANPRPGAQFRLFTDHAGLDVVRALYLDLTGQRVPPPVPRPGRVFVAENYALLSVVAASRRDRPRPPAVGPPRPERQGVETAWFAGDDPLPFFAMAAIWLGRGLAKAARRLAAVVRRRLARASAPTRVPPAPRQRDPTDPTGPAAPTTQSDRASMS